MLHKAGGNITRSRFVKGGTADYTVVQADANSRTIGIAGTGGEDAPIPSVTQDPPYAASSGNQVTVHTQWDVTPNDGVLLEAGTGGMTRFTEIESDANGKGVDLSTTAGTIRNIGAFALETAAEGELGRVIPVFYTKTYET